MPESFEKNPKFLEERFLNLAESPEVNKAASRTEQKTGELVSKEPEARIQNYLDRFKEIIERDDSQERLRGISALKKILTNRYVVRVEDVPDSYWQSQMRVVESRGELGDWQNLSPEEILKIKQEHLARAKEDQKGSLEEWIDYLTSDQFSLLPDYLKYWIFRGMLRIEQYEKGDREKGIHGRFPERPTGRQRSVKKFPEVNERGLRFIAKAYKDQAEGKGVVFGRYDIPQEAQEKFLEQLHKKNFRQLYGWTQEYLPPINEEEMKNTEGEWRTYECSDDPNVLSEQIDQLTESLRGKGSGWCIAGKELARQYLEQGNLYIYYTKDRDVAFTVPRVVIVEQNNRVTEVRGIEWEENVDEYIKSTNVIDDKLKELPNGKAFFEIDQDTKLLTAIDKKISAGQELNRGELIFLYEIDRPIKYFGYKKDPRIEELKKQRNPKEDAPIVFDCQPNEIAWSESEIDKNTKAYIGPLFAGIFNQLSRLDVYTSFPGDPIRHNELIIGGKSVQELKDMMCEKNIQISSRAEDVLDSSEFTTQDNPENIELVRLKVKDLGFTKDFVTIEQLYHRASELGLDLCPAEVGPYQILKDLGQSTRNFYKIAMRQIAGHDGVLKVFTLDENEGDFMLHAVHIDPRFYQMSQHRFLFCLRKST